MFLTNEQEVVVSYRTSVGYTLLGRTKSLLNGLDAFVLSKGRHLIVINTLGYDENYSGITWKITD